MGACASKFKVFRSGGDAAPPEDAASRDLNLAEGIMVQKEIKTPAPVDDEPKRQMLSNLFEESEEEAGTTENNGKESEEVKQEGKPMGKPQEKESIISAQSVIDAAGKDGDPGLENEGSQEKKKGPDVEPASQCFETEAQTAEDKPIEIAAKAEASEKLDDQGIEEPDEINKLVVKSSSNKESGAPCLEKGMEEKTEVEKGSEEKREAEMMEVKMPEAEKLPSSIEREMEKEQAEATKFDMPEIEKNDGQKPASDRTRDAPAESGKLQIPEGKKAEDRHNLDSEVEEKRTEEKLNESTERDIAEKKPEVHETEDQTEVLKLALDAENKPEMHETEDQTEVLKLVSDAEKKPEMQETEEQTELPEPASDAEKKSQDAKLLCPGTRKIESDAEKKTEDDQPSTGGTTSEREDEQEQAVEPPNTEQPGRGDKPEVKFSGSS